MYEQFKAAGLKTFVFTAILALSLSLTPMYSYAEEQLSDAIEYKYYDEVTFNHPNFSSVLSNGNLLMCKVGYRDPAVVEVTPEGQEVWRFKGIQATSAVRLANGNTLITDSGAPGKPMAPRVIEVSKAGAVVWEYRLPSLAQAPRYAQRLANGNTLITLPFQIIEVSPAKKTVWSYGWGKPVSPDTKGYLARPVQATRLASGNTVIVDRGLVGGKVFEITPAKNIVWEYGNWQYTDGTKQVKRPMAAVQLANGNTVIADPGTYNLLEVSPAGELVQTMSWRQAITGKGIMHQWHAAPLEDGRVLLTVSYTNSKSRVLEIQTIGTRPFAKEAPPSTAADSAAGSVVPDSGAVVPQLQ